MNGNFTLFKSDSASGSGAIDYVKDEFEDTSRLPTNNTGLSSTFSSNPLNNYYADDDAPKYGVKTLFIKDLVLIDDRSKWLNSAPTYRIVWNENFLPAQGYVYGNISLVGLQNHKYVQLRSVGNAIGVGGTIRKVIWLVSGDTSATATAQNYIDGVSAGSAISFSNIPAEAANNLLLPLKVFGFESASALQTQNIHDFQLASIQENTLKVIGAMVYFENAGANIEQDPGTTYIDKARITTTSGASLTIPSIGSTLGGNSVINKNTSQSYGITSTIIPQILSIATGLSGTNLLTVTTGQGASFPVGTGVVAAFGSTNYIGTVQNVSTDTLTVSPTLPIGISGNIYKAWLGGQSVPIGATLYNLAYQFRPSQYAGFTSSQIDPAGRWAVFAQNSSLSVVDQYQALTFPNAPTNGFFQIDGYFSAAEMEIVGGGILHGTVNINGSKAYAMNQAHTGTIKKTLFSDAGPGWNSINFVPGASFSGVGINKIDLYTVHKPFGSTLGNLATLDTLQDFVGRPAYNATLMPLGLYRRFYADQLGLQGAWVRSIGATQPGGIGYVGSTTNCKLTHYFYGDNYSIIGTPGTTMTVTLDGAPTGTTFNIHNAVTEGFHNLIVTNVSGTSIINAVDVARNRGELVNVQNYVPLPEEASDQVAAEIFVYGGNGYGNVASNTVRRFTSINKELANNKLFYNDSVANGGEFQIVQKGVWAAVYCESMSQNYQMGITVNSTELTTTIGLISPAVRAAIFTCPNVAGEDRIVSVSAILTLNPGDIVRAQTNALPADPTTNISFRLVLIKELK